MWQAGDVPVGGMMPMMPEAAAMGAPVAWLAYVEVADADKAVEETVKAGGKVLLPANAVPGVGRFAIMQDPQGAAFAVIASENQMSAEADPAPMHFSWHELTTTDSVAAADFYKKLFGWESKGDFDMGDMGMYRLFGRDRFQYGGMMNRPPGMEMPSYWLHYVRVADSADAAAKRATDAGATLVHGPMEVPGGDRVAILRDPQGGMFAVHSKPGA
jgi:hypothetical protein